MVVFYRAQNTLILPKTPHLGALLAPTTPSKAIKMTSCTAIFHPLRRATLIFSQILASRSHHFHTLENRLCCIVVADFNAFLLIGTPKLIIVHMRQRNTTPRSHRVHWLSLTE